MSSEEVLKTISMLSIVPDFLFFNCYVLSPFYKKNSNLCKIGIKKKAKIKNPEHRNNILNLL